MEKPATIFTFSWRVKSRERILGDVKSRERILGGFSQVSSMSRFMVNPSAGLHKPLKKLVDAPCQRGLSDVIFLLSFDFVPQVLFRPL